MMRVSMEGFVDYPADARERYRAAGVWTGIPLGEAFDAAATKNAERIAVVDGDRRFTYAGLRRASLRVASAFVRRGICDGAPVVFQLPNVAELLIAYLACLKVGAVPIACQPHHRETEIGGVARLAEATAWIFAPQHRQFDHAEMARRLARDIPSMRHLISIRPAEGTISFDDLLSEGREDDPALAAHVPAPNVPAVLQLSGGTTGVPKLIARTHDDYQCHATSMAAATALRGDDIVLITLPAAHNFPLVAIQGALLLGACIVLAPSSSPDVALPLIEKERVTWIPVVPAAIIRWTQEGSGGVRDYSSLRNICVGGQRLNPEPARAAMEVFGPVIRQNFGMSEGLVCCTRSTDPIEVHLETQGHPTNDLDEMRIVDEEDRDVPPGEIGELLCRGPYTIRGYYRAPEHNAIAFTADGFFRTGDLARIHPTGNIVIEGRKKDVINRGGEKISAEEIENLILKHAAVANAAVVALPDPVLGERVCACVTLHPGATLGLDALVAFLKAEMIAAFKLPERLETFDSLPMSGVGKVSKKDLRRIVAARAKAAP